MTNFVMAHQVLITAGVAYVWSALIGALPAPTKDSSSFYQFMFKFLNILGANIARAKSTRIEESPNWVDATKIIAPSPKL